MQIIVLLCSRRSTSQTCNIDVIRPIQATGTEKIDLALVVLPIANPSRFAASLLALTWRIRRWGTDCFSTATTFTFAYFDLLLLHIANIFLVTAGFDFAISVIAPLLRNTNSVTSDRSSTWRN